MAELTVRVTPRSARPGVARTADGTLEVRVRAPALEDRANREARERVAEAFGLSAARVGLIRGARARVKVLRLEGLDGEALRDALARLPLR